MPRPQSPKRRQFVLPGMVAHEPRPSTVPGHKRAQPERAEQEALIRWARLWASNPVRPIPQLALLHASLNGVHLTPREAAKAKASGMLSGVWDLFLPTVRRDDEGILYGGLWIEMKAGKNGLTQEQKAFQQAVGRGYSWCVSWTWHEAAGVILWYLDVPADHPAWQQLTGRPAEWMAGGGGGGVDAQTIADRWG